jgi:hypothetical protein
VLKKAWGVKRRPRLFFYLDSDGGNGLEMDRPTVFSRIAPSDGDILLGMRYNYFGKGSVNHDNEKGLFISRERRRE